MEMNIPTPKHCAHVFAAFRNDNVQALSERFFLSPAMVEIIVRHYRAMQHDLRAQACAQMGCKLHTGDFAQAAQAGMATHDAHGFAVYVSVLGGKCKRVQP